MYKMIVQVMSKENFHKLMHLILKNKNIQRRNPRNEANYLTNNYAIIRLAVLGRP
ncbi:conserved hypothetical protein [Trichinella spiralis]|uniref:hypothetical protein n=1 Tax=Trichinella spiralis TaxID=6334 RepID=UPI0001EFB673|nr:conserved hypothetical protein [Trichinella spiralis]